jgi:hypothetical protein
MSEKKKGRMDDRCPLGLNDFPTSVCPLAVERLRHLENESGNVSHLKESKLPGCDWYCKDKDSNYCFFSYIHDNKDKEHTTIEIAEKLSVTQAAVYSGLNRALEKVEKDVVRMIEGEE